MEPQDHKNFNLVGVRINPLDHEQILAQMREWISPHSSVHTIVFANTHVVMESRENSALAEATDAATLVVPDGMPIMLAARSRGYPMHARADGPGLMQKALTRPDCRSWRHYFYGSTQEVLSALSRQYPDALVAGSCSPPFRPLSPEEDARVLAEINASQADVLWVGLGCPKQEIWLLDHASRLQVPVILGVGQAFDLLGGAKKRAPGWMRAFGLEWFYRLLSEPRRLWKRYLLYNPWFVWLYLREQLGLWLGHKDKSIQL
jgi:N-acetylglucosaminyldiphosphoundecaprenol N-acetyl-beta-D-mannosaminyltransferase